MNAWIASRSMRSSWKGIVPGQGKAAGGAKNAQQEHSRRSTGASRHLVHYAFPQAKKVYTLSSKEVHTLSSKEVHRQGTAIQTP